MSVNNYSTTLIEFKNDSLFLTVLEYNYESMKDSFTYHIENDLLIIRNENFIDSSQFNIINDTILAFEKNDERFYKLNSKQYKTINLNDSLTGFYQVSSPYYNDTLIFLNNNKYLESSELKNEHKNFDFINNKNYSIYKYENLYFYCTSRFFFPPALIKEWSQDKVVLYYPNEENIIINLEKIGDIKKDTSIYGTWVKEKKWDKEETPILPPPPSDFYHNDYQFDISEETIILTINENKRTFNWIQYKNSIYCYTDTSNYFNYVFEVKNPTKDGMIFKNLRKEYGYLYFLNRKK